MNSYITGCLGLFSDTLSALWTTPMTRFFLSASVLAVAFALLRLLLRAGRSHV